MLSVNEAKKQVKGLPKGKRCPPFSFAKANLQLGRRQIRGFSGRLAIFACRG